MIVTFALIKAFSSLPLQCRRPDDNLDIQAKDGQDKSHSYTKSTHLCLSKRALNNSLVAKGNISPYKKTKE